MKNLLTILLISILSMSSIIGETYYSKTSGDLATLANWNSNRDGISGLTPSDFVSAEDIFIIQGIGGGSGSPHSMTVTTAFTIGSITNNTKLLLEDGASLTHTGANNFSFGSAAVFQIDNGGNYNHNGSGAFTSLFGGTESFAPNSTFTIGGTTSPGTGPSTLTFSGSFGNFIFSTSSSTTMQCNDRFPNVAGNFTKSSTTAEFRMAGSVAGNGGFTIEGNFLLSGGIFSFGNGSVASNLTVKGNFNLTGGTFLNAVTGGTAEIPKVCTLYLSKQGVVTFVKSLNTITANNSSNRRIRFEITSGTILDMGTNILDCVSGANVDFVINSGAGVRFGDEGGIVLQGTLPTTGNVRTSANSIRQLSLGGNYEYTGSEAQVTGTGLPASVNNLTINNAANVTLTNDLQVNGTLLKQSGDLILDGKNLTYGSTASTGAVQTLNAPSNVNVGGLGAEISSVANLGSTTVTRGLFALSGNSNQGIKRWYKITPTINTGLDATLVFPYSDGEELNGIAEGNLRLFKSTDDGTTWTMVTANVIHDAGANTFTVTGLDGFSTWTLGDVGSPLPVELTSLTANVNGKVVSIKWETATEIDNYGFEIERSKGTNNSGWINIGFVKGNGNSNSLNQYSYNDKSISQSGKYSYRLKQLDNSGAYKYYDAVEVDVTVPIKYGVSQNYPNPFNPSTRIEYQIPVKGNVSIKLYDVIGNQVMSLLNEDKEAGVYTLDVDAKHLSNGVYFYQIKSGDFVQTKKMTLLK
ncbi:MAG TPA: T9SS type A sorting domain-containing protein [Ignavibacteriaceae bacterium]|nr:T9SS type A sorting domain-containing protein [Ignavibacteriaceae bacterium]